MLLLLWLVSGCFSLFASLSVIFLISKHLEYYTDPPKQKYIIRILWLIPIYSIDAFMSLVFYDHELYFDVWKDCYEAYVLWAFFSLLASYLGGMEFIDSLLETRDPMRHPWPLCCLPSIPLGSEFLKWTKICIFQFVILKPILALASTIMEFYEIYEDGSFMYNRGYVYIAAVNNISVSISLYALVLFYKAMEVNLQAHNPLPKFLCIKAVIFLSFWQGLFILVMVKLQWIVDSESFTAGNIALFINHFLICFEMFILAILHHFVFSYEEFRNPSERKLECAELYLAPENPISPTDPLASTPYSIMEIPVDLMNSFVETVTALGSREKSY